MGLPKEERVTIQPKQPILNSNPNSTKSQHNKNINFTCLKICEWNIRKGLVKRETELRLLLQDEKIDIIFLTETDTKAIQSSADYSIAGFKTVFQNRKSPNDNLRIVGLIKNEIVNSVNVLDKIMDEVVPSIWLEFIDTNQRKTAICGFYREWTHEGTKSVEEQVKNMELFNNQIEKASAKYNNLIILGDANLCSTKWNEPNFKNKTVADCLRAVLTQCGLKARDIGQLTI